MACSQANVSCLAARDKDYPRAEVGQFYTAELPRNVLAIQSEAFVRLGSGERQCYVSWLAESSLGKDLVTFTFVYIKPGVQGWVT